MNRLTQDGTAKPIVRDQILRHEWDREICIFLVQLTTSRIGNLTGLIHTLLYMMATHTMHHTSELSVASVPAALGRVSEDTVLNRTTDGTPGCRSRSGY